MDWTPTPVRFVFRLAPTLPVARRARRLVAGAARGDARGRRRRRGRRAILPAPDRLYHRRRRARLDRSHRRGAEGLRQSAVGECALARTRARAPRSLLVVAG